ncbi:MAG: hypothetical protein ABIS18_00770 [Actinomycetota bacterium]
MDVLEEIEAIMEEVRQAKNVPLSASAMINRQDLLERLESVRASAPEELKQARWVMRDREELLSRTQREAEQLLSESRAERDRLLSRTEIVHAANKEADSILEEAKNRAREMRLEAEDYVDAKLASFEVILQKTLQAVEKGRESLRGRLEASAEDEDSTEENASETGNVRIRRP